MMVYSPCMSMPYLAGAPCTPFSPMGTGEGEESVVFQVHKKYYDMIGQYADILVVENVTEYNMAETLPRYLGRD